MSRKGVVACALGGAIISTTLLGSWLTREAEARTVSTKTSERAVHDRKNHKKTPKTRGTEKTTPPSQQTSHTRAQSVETKNQKRATDRAASASIKGARIGKFSITAYSHYRNRRGGLSKTATGALPRAGRTVAVDPRVIPLGSRIYIEGIGVRIAEDTGGKIKGKKLDLFLPSVQDCIQFGVRQREVHLIAQD